MRQYPFSLNGRITRCQSVRHLVKAKIVYALTATNHWSSTEYNQNNAWNVNFNNGNQNNNNKYNSNVVRAVAALGDEDIEIMIEAYEDCCKNKKTSEQCTLYRLRYEEDLVRLASEIKTRTYRPTTSITFVVTRPKLREIFAANFRDRIVQHYATLRIEPLLERRFIENGNVSFNCRKGFGTMRATKRLKSMMRLEGANVVAKFDVCSFFMSVDIDVLWQLLEPFIRQNYKGADLDTLLWLLKIIIYHRPQEDCERHGKLWLWQELPTEKSLFSNRQGVGMPIGNITSQLLANFYMSYFDEWAIEQLDNREWSYIRFVDDFVVVGKDTKSIMAFYDRAKVWLAENLHLKLHEKKIYIQPVRHGVKFVGSVVRANRIYLSNTTYAHLYDVMVTAERQCQHYDPRAMEVLMPSINSLFGFTRHCDSFNRRMKLVRKLRRFYRYLQFDRHYRVVKIKKQYKLTNLLQQQYELQVQLNKARDSRDYRGKTIP